MELDRDERKLEVFLSFHRATLTAADLKIFLPFTINLDPYIKKVIKEEQVQSGVEEEIVTGPSPWPQTTRQPHSKTFHKKPTKALLNPVPPVSNTMMSQTVLTGWNTHAHAPAHAYSQTQAPVPDHAPAVPSAAANAVALLRTAFPGLGDAAALRLSALSVERVCGLARAALNAGGGAAAAALAAHRVCGRVLAVCRLADLKPILDLPFGDWELFKMLIMNLRELEMNVPLNPPTLTVIADKVSDSETDNVKPRSGIEHQRSRPSNVEKQPFAEYQVTLEEQMICGALQTLNEEAMEDVLQSEPPPQPANAPPECPPPARAPVVSFSVESDDAPICFAARPRPPRARRAPRPSSLRLADDAAPAPLAPAARSLSVEDDLRLRGLRRAGGSAERLAWLRDKLVPRSDDESAPLVGTPSAEPSPRSDAGAGAWDSPPAGDLADLDLLPEGKGVRAASDASVSNMVEPYNMRLLSEGLRALWRQDALDCDPPWHEPDSAV